MYRNYKTNPFPVLLKKYNKIRITLELATFLLALFLVSMFFTLGPFAILILVNSLTL